VINTKTCRKNSNHKDTNKNEKEGLINLLAKVESKMYQLEDGLVQVKEEYNKKIQGIE